MKYEIEIIKAYWNDKRICEKRDIALTIFKHELRDAILNKDSNTRAYLTKITNDGSRQLIYTFDTYYSNKLTQYK